MSDTELENFQQQFIFFDLDGPILDISEKYYRAYYDMVTSYGKTPIDKDQYWGDKRKPLHEQEILKKSDFDQGNYQAYHDRRRSLMESDEYLFYDRVWPGTHAILEHLAQNWRLVMVTLRDFAEPTNRQLDRLGLSQYFEKILYPSEHPKQNWRVKVAMVQKAYGQGPFNGWFIGDTEIDIQAGQFLGVKTAAVGFGFRSVEQIRPFEPSIILPDHDQFRAWARALEHFSLAKQV